MRNERPLHTKGHKKRTSPATVERGQVAAQCLRLRRSGHSFLEIAEMVGITCAHPENRVRDIIEQELKALKRPATEDLISEELDILDRVINRNLRIMASDARDRVAAGNAVLAAQKRRADLLGLDAPKRVDLKDERSHDIPLSTVAAVVAELAAEFEQEQPSEGGLATGEAAGA